MKDSATISLQYNPLLKKQERIADAQAAAAKHHLSTAKHSKSVVIRLSTGDGASRAGSSAPGPASLELQVAQLCYTEF